MIAVGDDLSLPERTAAHVAVYLASSESFFSVYSSVVRMIEGDVDLEMLRLLLLDVPSTPFCLALNEICAIEAGCSWSCDIAKYFRLVAELDNYEDLIVTFCSRLLGGIRCIDQSLVEYRYGVGISTRPLEEIGRIPRGLARHLKRTRFFLAALRWRRRSAIMAIFPGLAMAILLQYCLITFKDMVLSLMLSLVFNQQNKAKSLH